LGVESNWTASWTAIRQWPGPLAGERKEVPVHHGLAERIKQDEKAVKNLLMASLVRSGALFGWLLVILAIAVAIVVLH
jgi:hypothetical protein